MRQDTTLSTFCVDNKKSVLVLGGGLLLLLCFAIYLSSALNQPHLVFSVSIRLAAFCISVAAYYFWRDWRILPLGMMFFLMVFGQSVQLYIGAVDIEKTPLIMALSEIPVFIVSILSLVSILYLWRLFSYREGAKKVEQSMQKSALEWSTAMDASDDAVFILDTNRHILTANSAFYVMTNSTSQTAIGQYVFDIIHPRKGEDACPVCKAQKEQRDAVIVMEPDDPHNPTGRPLEVEVQIVRNRQGEALSILMRMRDLTGEREIVEDFRVKEEEWKTTFNAMSDIVTIQDKDMRIIQANKAAHDVFTELDGGLLGKKCYEVFRGSEDPCPQCPGLISLKDIHSHSEIVRHGNLGKIFKVSSSPIMGENNEVEYLVHIARDITDEQQIEEERAMFNAIITHSSDAIYVIDIDTGGFLFSNTQGYRNLGYEESELKKLKVHDIGQNIRSDKDWKNHIADIKSHEFKLFETHQQKKDNTLLPVEINARIIEYHKQNFLVSVVRDISARKKAEEELIFEKNKLEAVVSALGDGLTMQDRNYTILFQNKTHQQMQGDHRGERCYEAYHERDTICGGCLLKRCFADGEVHRREIRTQTDDGWKDFEISASPIKDSFGKIISGIETLRDITERKKLASQVQQSQKMDAIGNLAGGIAHDFNNILSAVIGFAQLTKLDLRSLRHTEENIDQVIIAGNRATELVKQILTVSRKTEHKLQSLMPHLIIKEVLKMLRSSLPVTIKFREDIDTHCGKIMADPTKIHQIVMNLCTNALHAMIDEKGSICVGLCNKQVQAKQAKENDVSAGKFIVLSVSDTGHGMDSKTIAQIFEPYFTTKKVGEGAGLGLAVIHGIIRDYKGFVEVKSIPGKGTTFHVYIPLHEQESNQLEETVENEDVLPVGTEQILVVDDESAIVNLNKSILERLGYQVTGITGSVDALEQIRKNPNAVDLLITDQTMPALTGAELSKAVLQINPDMPIILCTGYSSIISEKAALAIGIKKYIKKPVDRRQLAQIVRKVLDGE